MKRYITKIDVSDEIRAALQEEEGFEENISEEVFAAEKNKGKKLNKPFRTPGGPKKFSVYVRNDKGNVVKVNFGDPNMEIKRDDPARRKSFRARHNCANPGPKTKAKYWSCKMWSKKPVSKVSSSVDYEDEILHMIDESEAKRPGPKSGAQTPAKPSEKKKGSSKNKPGSAGEKGGKITFSDKVVKALQQKVSDHNEKHPSKKVTLGQLKKVYRRGAGAFSSSHRPGMTRGGWAMARVNMFLKMKRGGKVKKSYREADKDISKSSEEEFFDITTDPTEEEVNQALLDINSFDLLEEDEDWFEEIFTEEIEANMSQYQFSNPGEAMKAAKKMGFDKIHNHKTSDGKNVFMPGPSHEALVKKLKEKGETKEKSESKKGLWENIRDKKRREGKNYRPAKPGDKDRPQKKAWDKAKNSKKKKK
jgi:hypothetical protein